MIYIIITYVPFFYAAGGSDFRNQQHYFWTLELSFKVLEYNYKTI